jgi:hypothetical protein
VSPIGATLNELEAYYYEKATKNSRDRFGLTAPELAVVQSYIDRYTYQLKSEGGAAYIPRISKGNFQLK